MAGSGGLARVDVSVKRQKKKFNKNLLPDDNTRKPSQFKELKIDGMGMRTR
jgi:hypothetical protein